MMMLNNQTLQAPVLRWGLLLLLSCLTNTWCHGQIQIADASGDTVRLNAQGEIPLKDLVEYIAERTGLQVLYDQSLTQKKVNLVAPEPIPVSGLLDILQTILRAEGLILVDSELAGWKRIVSSDRLAEVAKPSFTPEQLAAAGATTPLTQVFTLKNAEPTAVVDLIQPFLTKQSATIVPLDNQSLLIVTDVAQNVRRAAELIEILDTGKPSVDVKFIKVKHVSARDLAEQLKELLSARGKALGRGKDEATGVEVTVDERSNQVVLIGTAADVARAEVLLESLDTSLPTIQATYSLQFITPGRLEEVIRGILEARTLRPPFKTRVEGNVLIVDSTQEVLQLVERMRRELDTREAPASQSPIRFYKIRNVPAEELVETLLSIGGRNASNTPQRQGLPARRRTTNDAALHGPNNFGGYPQSPYFAGAAQQSGTMPLGNSFPPYPGVAANTAGQVLPLGTVPQGSSNLGNVPPTSPANIVTSPERGAFSGQAQVTVDVHTNTIIVVAEPEEQRIYASLIQTLDQRRPQVLVEAKIVIVDTSDNYALGVEISGGDREGAKKLFAFSSYGLSTVNPVNGALQVIPGLGFNGTLIDPSTADVVVRTLATHRRSRVLSTPKILVNDNAEGQLTSVLEVPFTSVNASQTVATTSFAGFAEAGTTITVTPTISDDNFLQLDYVVTLNSFTGAGTAGVPPPRQTNEVRSRITIPDGYTVIVGGLTSKNDSYTFNGFPVLENIPVLRELTSQQTDNKQQTTLFVFLKPIILREDLFKDLKFLSEKELKRACLPRNLPLSEPIVME